MLAIFKKEINSFFSSAIGYLVIAVFLVLNGLFLWVFDSDYNILNAGFADLSSFFYISPWIFLFLIPAVTMRSFADEYNSGTIELLKTQPLSNWDITLGKYFASLLLIVIAIIPTLIYVYSISKLGSTPANYDLGSLLGSYFGLFFLTATYTAIGTFSSSITNNQIVAFVIAITVSLFLYAGFDAMASLFGSMEYTVQNIGMNSHFKSMSRGVLDTRDVLYFTSITVFFLFLIKWRLDRE